MQPVSQTLKIITTAALLMVSPVLLADADNPFDASPYEEVYQQSGLDRQLGTLWQQVIEEYQGLAKVAAEPTNTPYSLAPPIETQFSAANFRNSVIGVWQAQISADNIALILQWLKTPIGAKLTEAELEASVAADRDFSLFLKQLKDDPPSTSRIELLRQLEKALHSSAASTDLGININLAAYNARHALGLAPANALSPEQHAKSHENDRALIQALMRQDILKYNLFSYRHIPDDSIRAYTRFARSTAGENFHKATFFALRQAFSDATERLLEDIRARR